MSLITNEKLEDMGIADCLDIEYLSPVKNVDARKWHCMKGILYGNQFQPFVNIAICSKIHKKYINVIFIVDFSFDDVMALSTETIAALGFTSTPTTLDILCKDIALPARETSSTICVIGSVSLKILGAHVEIKYKDNEIYMSFL